MIEYGTHVKIVDSKQGGSHWNGKTGVLEPDNTGEYLASVRLDDGTFNDWPLESWDEIVAIDEMVDTPEAPQALPTNSAARKGVPVTTGVFDYFPAALAYVAVVSKAGNDKHNPGEPLHWARGKSTDQADAIGRHLLERGGIDPDTGLRHSGELAWRALALLQLELEEAGLAPLARGATEA